MASGPLVGAGGGGSGGGNGSREKHRWADNKVYTRKSHKTSSKSNPSSQPPPQNPPQEETPKARIDGVDEDVKKAPPADLVGSDDDVANAGGVMNGDSGGGGGEMRMPVLPRRPLVVREVSVSGQQCVTISPGAGSREEVRNLRNILGEELEKVRAFYRKLEIYEAQLSASAAAGPITPGYSHSQLSETGGHPFAPPARKAMSIQEGGMLRRKLSVATGQVESYSMSDATEKEKRTPKANQYYRNSEFVLGKDRLPPPPSTKKSKANGGKKHGGGGHGEHVAQDLSKVYAHAFRNCRLLLASLMKHQHGWVFNHPVDVKGLGLHDYYSIIKHPMDLGTIKTRLSKNWYKFPKEFAEDVRLTFHNAMLYNPKGQDVHYMAEELLSIFDEQWSVIEAELTLPSYPVMNKKTPPPLDMKRILERSESTTHPALPDITPKSITHTPHTGRTPALKKPKAKDPHKRDMTYEEKQKLSNNLQNLPPEKLDVVVQIIKKRNSSLSQHDDEIEVDIDSVDTETLWELDRFVTNYKKSLSKHKRKAELAMQARQEAEQNIQAKNLHDQEPAVVEKPSESKSDKQQMSPPPVVEEKKGDNESRSSSSCSSSSDSGSSSSDSDSESSSG